MGARGRKGGWVMTRKPSNWGTVSARRGKGADAPRPDVRPPRPEVLPTLSEEELKRREERIAWLAAILAVED